MGNISLPNGMPLPEGFDRKLFSNLLLTFGKVDYADEFVNETFPELSYADKFKILCEYFDFAMVGGYVPEGQSPEDKAKADYLFTLQHLLNKAKAVGINGVVKPAIQAL
jgi:hypothetical protein